MRSTSLSEQRSNLPRVKVVGILTLWTPKIEHFNGSYVIRPASRAVRQVSVDRFEASCPFVESATFAAVPRGPREDPPQCLPDAAFDYRLTVTVAASSS